MRHVKNILIIGCLVLGLVVFSGIAGAEEKWQGVESGIDREATRALSDAKLTESLIKKDRKTLVSELAVLKENIAVEQTALDGLKAQFEELSLQEVELKEELEREHREVADVEGSVRGALKDAVTMVRDNPITAQNPERSRMVNAMMDSKKFPGMAGIKSIVDLYFEELSAGGQIVRYTGEFVGRDGKSTTGEIIRAGRFTGYYRLPDGTVGFLKPESSGERLLAIEGEAPRAAKKAITSYFDAKGTVLPVDPSGGAVFAQMTKKTDWGETFKQGGVLMWPILLVACIAVLLMIERLIVLGRTKGNSDKVMDRLNALAEKGNWKKCTDVCELNNRMPTCRMLKSALGHIGQTQEILENALQEAILREMPRLERFLPTLAVLAAIAPLLGLLGTVTGMINTFEIITVVGTGDPRMMSGGISEALLTTQFGLAVAIPIMMIHHLLQRRVDKIAGDMEEKGTAFAVTMLKGGAIAQEEA
ncbi:MAG: MotA/TolQ/ExbB proton channel family protein [Deltaproteobacteria bacterium]|nr:MotA/TolQ/ExbB proton channel family protein [Deltaproteobacteria bacterium]